MSNPLWVLTILVVNILISEWLENNTFLRHLGTTLLVIILTAVVANLGVIPSATESSVVYDAIFTYVAPLSVFFLLLDVRLSELKKAGLPMLTMFLIGAAGTALGAVVAIWLIDGPDVFGEHYKALAGMMTGTYIGGSLNFNAIALHYGVMKEGGLYAGTVAVDNILTTVWMVVTLVLPRVLGKIWKRVGGKTSAKDLEEKFPEEKETVSMWSLAALLSLGGGSLLVSDWLAVALNAAFGWNFPSILIVTTIALVLAQFKAIRELQGSRLLGLFTVYLFLAVIGAFCELAALGGIGELALYVGIFTLIVVVVHGLVTFGVGGLLKVDWDVIAIASQANVGGASSAMALAKSLKREDLLLPAIVVGSLGVGLGTYVGFLVAEVLL
ncbi:DUF819 family protein [uncultured Imperialibacter sp.]|uniref:DUF819 family protein n=1 Tax=uncultured Imperialibacter sp. TaxID=1672639 RepID=UPI0030D7D1CB|tara:strand:- start:4132 stop:5283 length:1152 start_codon:yes stop_codon:yes gene_type:complete